LKDNNCIIIRIEDTGIGIAKKYLEKIFQRFYRTESSRTSGGTGLGLSFARTIVRQHKGEIIVTSFPDQGSVFEITLPYRNPGVI
ncbi:MAG: sensor histidine kinase, partial [Desulfobacula sp.]|nr:sensor histidine kinase [Desulfobacula sp.]